jgi:hypothetical protein
MDISNTTPPASPASKQNQNMILVIMLFGASVVSSFIGGYILSSLTKPANNTPIVTITPTPEPTDVNEVPEPGTSFQSGKNYFDDTIMAITEDTPHRIVVATVTRHEQEGGVNQGSRVSYFNGSAWTRKVQSKVNDSTAIHTNNLIADWNIDIDPSRVLKQTVNGKLLVDQNTIFFDTGTLTNNISIRSLPGYTKFMSNSTGNITIGGAKQKSKILYTRIYSNNSAELQFYDTPFGLTTHWLAFWDQNGNFYHLDSTNVPNPTAKYQTHQLGVKVDNLGRVSKTFQVSIQASNENPPKSYQITFGSPIDQTLELTIGASNNKAPNNTYSWFMSDVSGKVDGSISGYGAVEYIHN